MKENQNGAMYDQNGCEKDAHRSWYEAGDLDKSDQFVAVNGSANGKGEGGSDLAVPCGQSTTDMKSSEKETDRFFVDFIDQSVGRCELPVHTASCREINDHVVKNISVDEGVPYRDEILLDNSVDEHKSNGSCPHSQTEQKTGLLQEKLVTNILLIDGAKVSDRNELGRVSSKLCRSKDLEMSEVTIGAVTNIIEVDGDSYSVCRQSAMEQECDSVRNGSDTGILVPCAQTVPERNESNKDSATMCSPKDLEKSADSKGDEINMIEYDGYKCSNGSLDEYDSAHQETLTEQKSKLLKNGSDNGISVLDWQTVSAREELKKDSAIPYNSEDLVKSGMPNGDWTEHDNSDKSIVVECDNASKHPFIEQHSEVAKEESDSANPIPDGLRVLDSNELEKNSTMLCSSYESMKSIESKGEETYLTEDDLFKVGFVNNCDGACQTLQMGGRTDSKEKESLAGILDSNEATISNKNEVAMLGTPEDLVKSEEVSNEETNKIGDENSTQMTPLLALSPLKETGAGSLHCKSNAHDSNNTNQQSNKLSDDEAKVDSSASVSSEAGPIHSPDEAVLAAPKSSAHENTRKITFSSELSDNEEGGSITIDFDSNIPVLSSRGDFSLDNVPKHLENPNASQTQNRIPDARSVLNQEENSHGETSFSVSVPSSGRISYSGAIPYSGSVSVRSDGSATSARSFAFPVLQPEWNSSPARMARADHRALQKNRRWRYCLLCCSF